MRAELVAGDVRGLQVGQRNYQLNSYRIEVQAPEIDFTSVLSQAKVMQAFQCLAENPDESQAIHEVDRILRKQGGGGPFRFDDEPDIWVFDLGRATVDWPRPAGDSP